MTLRDWIPKKQPFVITWEAVQELDIPKCYKRSPGYFVSEATKIGIKIKYSKKNKIFYVGPEGREEELGFLEDTHLLILNHLRQFDSEPLVLLPEQVQNHYILNPYSLKQKLKRYGYNIAVSRTNNNDTITIYPHPTLTVD
jgi:hypothetical protein